MKKLLIAVGILCAFAVQVGAQTKQKKVRNVEVIFNTTTNDKDHDTYLYVSLNVHDFQIMPIII